MTTALLWQPMLEAAAQTIIGAVSSYSFSRLGMSLNKKNTFSGPMDLWQRGIRMGKLTTGDAIYFDGLLSPYTQLFPGDPLENAVRWNVLYNFSGKIDKAKYQAMEFFAGSDAALRIGSLNGESIVGLYDRYGFVGEGIVGVLPTKLLLRSLPDFFHPSFFGERVLVSARLSRCPAQHGFVAQSIAASAGIDLDISKYKDLWYLQINGLHKFRSSIDRTASLLGSPWAVTSSPSEQYLVQYGYMNNERELANCIHHITKADVWEQARVFFDDIKAPSQSLSFKAHYLT